MAKRRAGHGEARWNDARARAGVLLAQFRAQAGTPGRPMPLDDFGRRLGAILGTTPYDHSDLSTWERGLADFPAVVLIAAAQVAGLDRAQVLDELGDLPH